MSEYKVLQDIEAEDKLVGPLSLRQFIYAAVAAVAFYVCFLAYTKGVPFLLVFFLPVAAIGTFFGFPWKGEQPTEIWALARLRFMVKPRVRIWNQSGVKDVVTINAPRNVQVRAPVRNLSQYEVRSRLKALADTIDSRGWATRNANYQIYMNQLHPQSDRLVNASDLQPGAIPMDAFLPSNDMLDDQGRVAQNLDALLNRSTVAQRQRAIEQMNAVQVPATVAATMQEAPGSQSQPYSPAYQTPQASAPAAAAPMYQTQGQPPAQNPNPNQQWFVNNPNAPAMAPLPAMPTAAIPQPQPAQQIAPVPAAATPTAAPAPAATPAAPLTRPANPAILELANNNDLDIATIARQAHNRKVARDAAGEVEVQLR